MEKQEQYLVKQIPNSNLYDVWQGKGWDQWSRVLVKADFVKVIKGERIPPKALYRLFEAEQRRKATNHG